MHEEEGTSSEAPQKRQAKRQARNSATNFEPNTADSRQKVNTEREFQYETEKRQAQI
jgi:hypothetical protein